MIEMTVRGRWIVDDHGKLQEEKPPAPAVEPQETEEDRKKRERAERDVHPGNYI